MNLHVVIGAVAILWLAATGPAEGKVTRASLESSGKLMRNVCQPKNKTPDDLINNMKNLKFPEDRSLMCYVSCVMTMMQTMKGSRFNYDASMKQVDIMMPENMKAATKAQLTACKDIADGYKDPCDAAFYSLKCMVESNPDNYFFP